MLRFCEGFRSLRKRSTNQQCAVHYAVPSNFRNFRKRYANQHRVDVPAQRGPAVAA